MQYTATRCNTLLISHHYLFQATTWQIRTTSITATCYKTLQHTATHCYFGQQLGSFSLVIDSSTIYRHTATHCYFGQQLGNLIISLTSIAAAYCKTLEHTAISGNNLETSQLVIEFFVGWQLGKLIVKNHCNILQHTATFWAAIWQLLN